MHNIICKGPPRPFQIGKVMTKVNWKTKSSKNPNKQRLKFQFYNHIDNKSLYLIQTEYSIAALKDFKPKTSLKELFNIQQATLLKLYKSNLKLQKGKSINVG